VRAGRNACSASDASVVVDFHVIAASVIAKLDRTGSDTSMTIGAIFFDNGNNGSKFFHGFT
jgi:hypothetical protein